MKKIIFQLIVSSCLLIQPGCKKTTEKIDPVLTEPLVTPKGAISGTAVNKKIGPEGGSVLSADGRAELIFPAGAVSGDVDVVVQPITNNIPNGVNSAYRFLPDGQTFLKPVTLKIHYTDADLSATLADLMGIGFQDSTGAWWRVNNFTNDPVNKVISAPIHHFSDWAEFDVMIIDPVSASINVDKSIALSVEVILSDDELLVNDLKSPDEIAPLNKFTMSADKIVWSANGIVNGNSSVGTLTANSVNVANYKAPSKAPGQNPVAVSAVVDVKFKYHGKTFDKTSLISNISIIGGKYHLEIVEKRDDLQLGMWVTDSSTMDIELGGDVVLITNIKNYAPLAAISSVSTNGCTFSYIPEATGRLNITEATGEMRIQSATERAVQFFFTHSGTVEYSYRQFCPVPVGPPFDVTTPNEAFDGEPLTLFFDLTDSVMHDNVDLSFVTIHSTLTLKKE